MIKQAVTRSGMEIKKDELENFLLHHEFNLEPRPISIQLGVVDSIKGSAYMEFGNTKVLAVVEAPREITNQIRNIEVPCNVSCLVHFIPISTADPVCLIHREDMLAISLKKVLESSICREKFSNVQLDIRVTILEDDGCALATAINCCGAALVVAGIPIYDIITASTICFYKNTEFVNAVANIESIFSNINEESEIYDEYGIVTTASFPSFRQVIGCFQRGMLPRATFARLVTQTLELNERISQSLKQALLKSVKKNTGITGSF